jgi:hypothetical protein
MSCRRAFCDLSGDAALFRPPRASTRSPWPLIVLEIGSRRSGSMLDFCSGETGFIERQHIHRALSGERPDFLEVDHLASLVLAGITPGLYAFRLGRGTMSAVTFRA